MQRKTYRLSDRRCIFCLNEFDPAFRTDEHIIPEALHGELIIEDGSCKACARASNEDYENSALNTGYFHLARVVLGLKGKRGAPARDVRHLPPIFPGNAMEEGEGPRLLDFPLDQYPAKVLQLMHYQPPGKIDGVDRGGDLNDCFFGFFFTDRQQMLPTNRFTQDIKVDHTAVARMLAKIAYCYAVVKFGLSGFDGQDLRDIIAGNRTDIYNFVGSYHGPRRFTNRFLHNIYLHQESGYLTVLPHLFASFGGWQTPMLPYQVVIQKS